MTARREEEAVCRCCLRGSGTISIFSWHKSAVSYADMMRECCSLDVTTNDEMPSTICLKCSGRLKSSYKFRRLCQQTNGTLVSNIQTYKHLNNCENVKSESSIATINSEIALVTCDKTTTVYIQNKSEHNEYKYEHIPSALIKESNVENDFKLGGIKTESDSIIPNGDSCKVESDLDVAALEFSDIETKDELEIELDVEDSLGDKNLLLELMKEWPEEESEPKDLKTKIKLNSSVKQGNIKSAKASDGISSEPAKETGKHVCRLCNKKCKQSQQLVDHINWVHRGIKYYCELCKKCYTSKLSHIRNSHTESKQCALCGVMFETKLKYYTHMNAAHRKDGPLRCEECETICTSKASLDRHKMAVHGEPKFICQYCSRTYRRKDKLDEHIRTHTKEKPHACDLCPLRFPSRHLLNRHTVRHTAQRDIKCDHCSAMFRTKGDLRQHITRHDDTFKRYACAVCGKLFRRSDHRNIHQRNVHRVQGDRGRHES